MNQDHAQQNSLAFMLAKHLFKATDKFRRDHPAININGVIGAANVYLASQYTLAPDKDTALANLEEDFDIIREMINSTPPDFFGRGLIANLN